MTKASEEPTTKPRRQTSKPEASSSEPTRTCVGCRRRAGQSDLTRLAVVDGRLALGSGAGGRGAWICTGQLLECFDAATEGRRWSRALRSSIAVASIAELRAKLAAGS